MTCPHCHQPIPDNNPACYCCHCGRGLPAAESDPAHALTPFRIKWRWFWLALLAPPVLTLLSALLMRLAAPTANNESVSPFIALVGSAGGGIAGGIIVGLKRGETIPERVLTSIACAVAFSVLCLILSFAGCNLGGYHFVIR